MITTPLALLLGLAGCSDKEEDGFGSGGGHSSSTDDSAAEDTGGPVEDTDPPPDLVDDGTAPTGEPETDDLDEIFDAVWVRCEEADGAATWTFHAELDFTAAEVTVASGIGTASYELWYLQPWNVAYTVWEVEVPPGFSGHPCQDEELTWTARGETGWESSQTTQYTAE